MRVEIVNRNGKHLKCGWKLEVTLIMLLPITTLILLFITQIFADFLSRYHSLHKPFLFLSLARIDIIEVAQIMVS